MPVVRRPRSYTALSLMILWAIPVFFLNVWVLHKGVVAKVLQRESYTWMAVQAGWTLITLFWLLRASWKGLASAVLLSVAMFGANLFFLVSTKNYALAFYALFLLIISLLYCLHLYRSLAESYYHSGQRWFEGRPRLLPAVEVGLRAGEQLVPARLSRLGIEGCYAYPLGKEKFDPRDFEAIQLKLGDLKLECAVELVSRSKDLAGAGFRFVADTSDGSKDIRDFIDRVRSAGYVL